MGKRLIIMRHAKSSWTSGASTDHQRPLNKRGRHAAPRIGARLRDIGWIPDMVIASDSERTRETWQRM
jgi:phosphohistidine phosphatase